MFRFVRRRPLARRTCDLDVDVVEAAVDHLERETHFGAGGDAVEEALFGVRVDGQVERVRRPDQDGRERDQRRRPPRPPRNHDADYVTKRQPWP